MKKTRKSPDKYLDSLPPENGKPMKQLDRLLARIMKGLPRVLWEGVFWGGSPQAIIGYGELRQTRGPRTVEWFKVGLALQKNYMSLYVNAVEDGKYLPHKYRSRLGRVKLGSASISFARIEDVDLDVLAELLTSARKQLA